MFINKGSNWKSVAVDKIWIPFGAIRFSDFGPGQEYHQINTIGTGGLCNQGYYFDGPCLQ